MGAEPLLTARGLCHYFGAIAATDGFDIDVRPGELHALIGPNGAGKTTAVNQLAGELRSHAGAILFRGRDLTGLSADQRARAGLARSFQISSLFSDLTVLENAMLAVQAHQGHSFRFWRDARRDDTLRAPARELLELTGLGGQAQASAATLAHGEKRRLELAMALAGSPLLLLLDEPMSGAGPDTAAEIMKLLDGLRGRLAILLIEHDMDAVFSLADRITVMVAGRAIACGDVDSIRANPEVQSAYLGAA